MMEKNRDPLYDNLIQLCFGSQNPVLKEIFKADGERLAAQAKG